MEANGADLGTVNFNFAFTNVGETEERLQDARFAGTGAANNAYFHARLDADGEAAHCRLELFSVLHGNILEVNFAIVRPVFLIKLLINIFDKTVFTF